MTGERDDRTRLQAAIRASLDLIARSGPVAERALTVAAPLPSLLDQCRALRDAARAEAPAPLRLLHHFACTGGTIIAKCLATMPNTVLLSEIDPLSLNHMTSPSRFAPSDLIKQLRYGRHAPSDALAAGIFLAGLGVLQAEMRRTGRHLVLRDHAHSQFCTGADWTARPTLREMVARDHATLSVLTLRHPLASYLSLQANNWVQFTPPGPEEYARRYAAFLDRHDSIPTLRYEDFVADPEPVLERLCALLALPYRPGSALLAQALQLSGDSGRAGAAIAPRAPRAIPPTLADEVTESPAFARLCARLGYDLLPE